MSSQPATGGAQTQGGTVGGATVSRDALQRLPQPFQELHRRIEEGASRIRSECATTHPQSVAAANDIQQGWQQLVSWFGSNYTASGETGGSTTPRGGT